MRIALTGASGNVGGFIAAAALRAGHEVLALGRGAPPAGLPAGALRWAAWQLGQSPDLPRADVLVHAAFSHVPGRFRGGEGDDPAGFVRANLDGSRILLDAAAAAGVGRIVLLSSRAVFDGYPPGTRLTPDLPPRPGSLYGEVKAELEAGLRALAAGGSPRVGILRATGVYGRPAPGWPHKWSGLLRDLLAGRPIAPRVATEVHGADLARAVLLCLAPGLPDVDVQHASDIVLDHRDLAAEVGRILGRALPLPPRSDASALSMLDAAALRRRGWRPGGWGRLAATLTGLLN